MDSLRQNKILKKDQGHVSRVTTNQIITICRYQLIDAYTGIKVCKLQVFSNPIDRNISRLHVKGCHVFSTIVKHIVVPRVVPALPIRFSHHSHTR